MATKSITITKPLIFAPTKFTVYYRLIPDPTWILHGLENNTTFTLTVPTEGIYEIKTELEGCQDFIYGPITILADPPCDCAVVDTPNVTFVDIDAATTVLRIPFSSIPTLGFAPCGWIIELKEHGTGVSRSILRTVLTNPLDIVVPKGIGHDYVIKIDCCGGNIGYCGQGSIEPDVVIDPCEPVILRDDPSPYAGSAGVHLPASAGGSYSFTILFKQSVPSRVPISVIRNQGRGSVPGIPAPDYGVTSHIPVASGDPTYPWQITVAVYPTAGNKQYYSIYVQDSACGGANIYWL